MKKSVSIYTTVAFIMIVCGFLSINGVWALKITQHIR
jgi:hypothetical protein